MNGAGSVPNPEETAAVTACQFLVMELFARFDARDLDAALELYDDDAVFLQAAGKAGIRLQMERGMAASADKRSRHVITNVRASVVSATEISLQYTALAFTVEGPGPFAPRSVLDQQQRLRRGADGRYRIIEHLIPDLTLS